MTFLIPNHIITTTKRTITAHIKSSSIKKIITYGVGNPCPCFGQSHRCGRVMPVNGIPVPLMYYLFTKQHVLLKHNLKVYK
jgi:hypothetical protein